MALKEDDVVFCMVKKIEGTTVFVDVEDDGEGSISLSEIAAGRIRNIRDYVSPGKKIVCKVLKIINGHPQLSLRRVTAKERDEAKERYEKERSLFGMLKAVVKNPQEILEKIKLKYEAHEFLESVKEDIKTAEEFLSKEIAQAFKKILSEKKEKQKEVKKEIVLKSFSPEGVKDIKDILSAPSAKGIDIKYLGSSKFSLSASAKDPKTADHKIQLALKEIESRAKAKKMVLEIK